VRENAGNQGFFEKKKRKKHMFRGCIFVTVILQCGKKWYKVG
jgi:hypothetical protein